MRAGVGAALDGDQADLHALAFDHRPFGGRITLAYGHPRELGEVEKKAAVARLGCTPVPCLLCAHGVTCLSTTYTRAALLYACAVSVELEPMG